MASGLLETAVRAALTAPGIFLTLRRIAGGAALSGIGFTISLFIVDIAISEPTRQDQARIGVLHPLRVRGDTATGFLDGGLEVLQLDETF